MKPIIRDSEVLARMEATFDLNEAAEDMMRQNIRRRHPELDEAAVEERLDAWYTNRPAELDEHVARPYRHADRLK